VGCAKAILKNADIPNYNHIVLTDLGIEKDKNFTLSDEDVRKVKDASAPPAPARSLRHHECRPRQGGCCG